MSMKDKVVTLEDLSAAMLLIENTSSSLPDVTVSDEGKFLRVDSNGEWAVEELQQAEGSVF